MRFFPRLARSNLNHFVPKNCLFWSQIAKIPLEVAEFLRPFQVLWESENLRGTWPVLLFDSHDPLDQPTDTWKLLFETCWAVPTALECFYLDDALVICLELGHHLEENDASAVDICFLGVRFLP